MLYILYMINFFKKKKNWMYFVFLLFILKLTKKYIYECINIYIYHVRIHVYIIWHKHLNNSWRTFDYLECVLFILATNKCTLVCIFIHHLVWEPIEMFKSWRSHALVIEITWLIYGANMISNLRDDVSSLDQHGWYRS